jgi:PII-like signaling protein
MKFVEITIYINEADKWQHRPLDLELMNMLDEQGIAGGTVLRAVAGFTYHKPVESTSLVDVNSRLPLVVQFIDIVEKVDAVMPLLKDMVGNRLIIRQPVDIVNGTLPASPVS